MKRMLLAALLASVIFSPMLNAQVTTLSNVSPAGGTPFLGWNSAGAVRDLDLRNDFNRPINFFTNNNQRMVLTQTGLLGLGHTNPVSMLSVFRNQTSSGSLFRTTGLNAEVNTWQLFTTPAINQTGTEKFRLWTDAVPLPWINQQADNSLGLRFFTPSTSTNTTPLLRFQVNGYMLANIDGTSVNTSGFALLTANPTFLTNPGSAQSPYL